MRRPLDHSLYCRKHYPKKRRDQENADVTKFINSATPDNCGRDTLFRAEVRRKRLCHLKGTRTGQKDEHIPPSLVVWTRFMVVYTPLYGSVEPFYGGTYPFLWRCRPVVWLRISLFFVGVEPFYGGAYSSPWSCIPLSVALWTRFMAVYTPLSGGEEPFYWAPKVMAT